MNNGLLIILAARQQRYHASQIESADSSIEEYGQ
jgi:hypothetical protein